ncbi:MAG TPA: DUF488 family protein [Thiobacillus sp.]
MDIRVKRVYEAPAAEDGMRILVDRLWPRGLTKEKARIDLWLKELAPSAELRKWFNHEPDKWEEFKRRYLQELQQQPAALAHAIEAMGTGPVTLLFAAREVRFNDAVALREFILARNR